MGMSRILALPLREAMHHPEFTALMGRFVPKGFNWITPLITAEIGLETWRMASHWWGERKVEADSKKGVKALETATKVVKRLDTTDSKLAEMDAKFLAMMAKLDVTNKLLAEQKAKLGTVEVAKIQPKPVKAGAQVDALAIAL